MWLQVDGSERDDVMRHALEIVAAAPQDEARRMAHMVMSSVDQHDHDRFAEQFVELNLALGNRDAALAAIVNAALAEQRRGSYKACSSAMSVTTHDDLYFSFLAAGRVSASCAR